MSIVIDASLQIVVTLELFTEILPAVGISCTLTIVDPVRSKSEAVQPFPSNNVFKVYLVFETGLTVSFHNTVPFARF